MRKAPYVSCVKPPVHLSLEITHFIHSQDYKEQIHFIKHKNFTVYEQPIETPPNAAVQCWFRVLEKPSALECCVHVSVWGIEVLTSFIFCAYRKLNVD